MEFYLTDVRLRWGGALDETVPQRHFSAGANFYDYDGAGRLTNHVVHGRTRAFTYDFTGRMTTLTDTNGSVFAYEFDAEGNRLSQALNDCLSKRFVHDGPDVLLELNPANAVA